jgi:hypothetical protein
VRGKRGFASAAFLVQHGEDLADKVGLSSLPSCKAVFAALNFSAAIFLSSIGSHARPIHLCIPLDV